MSELGAFGDESRGVYRHHVHAPLLSMAGDQPLYPLARRQVIPAFPSPNVPLHELHQRQLHGLGGPLVPVTGLYSLQPRPAAEGQPAALFLSPAPGHFLDEAVTEPHGEFGVRAREVHTDKLPEMMIEDAIAHRWLGTAESKMDCYGTVYIYSYQE